MRKLTEQSTQDASAVRVLSVITLIYLPATVVSVGDQANVEISCTHEGAEFLLHGFCRPETARRVLSRDCVLQRVALRGYLSSSNLLHSGGMVGLGTCLRKGTPCREGSAQRVYAEPLGKSTSIARRC